MRASTAKRITIVGRPIVVRQLGCKSASGQKAVADRWIAEGSWSKERVERALDDNMCCYGIKVEGCLTGSGLGWCATERTASAFLGAGYALRSQRWKRCHKNDRQLWCVTAPVSRHGAARILFGLGSPRRTLFELPNGEFAPENP